MLHRLPATPISYVITVPCENKTMQYCISSTTAMLNATTALLVPVANVYSRCVLLNISLL